MELFQTKSSENVHHFFKMIHSGNTFPCTELMIPTEFTRKCGKSLPDHVYLETPAGLIFPVDLERRGKQVWLQKGWPEFAKFHSLCHGHLVVFQYKESSNKFVVFICDENGIGFQYPSSSSVHPNQKTKPAFREAMHYGESSKMKLKSKLDSSRASKQQAEKEDTNQEKEREIESNEDDSKSDDDTQDHHSISIEADDESAFKLVLDESHKTDLPLPSWYARKALQAGHSEIVLRDPTGKKWWSKINEQSKQIVHLTGGWVGLYIANKLKKGDTCTFIYEKRSEGSKRRNNLQVIQVLVYRGRGRPPKINKNI